MTLTAMRPDSERSNECEMSLWSDAHASASISAFSVVFSAFVGVVRAEEIGVPDEEALLVVVGVDEPAGDAAGAVAADLAGGRVEDVHAVDPHLDPIAVGVFSAGREDVDVRVRDRRDERDLAALGEDPVRRLAAGVELPVPGRVLVRRVQDRLLEECSRRRHGRSKSSGARRGSCSWAGRLGRAPSAGTGTRTASSGSDGSKKQPLSQWPVEVERTRQECPATAGPLCLT